ncbi:xanthine dehydrogenase YagT iron-sulfur-binding subunit [Altererythrobacter atlanticus]|uniref:Nicotinate dehydrogenase small FeS subunit n=1 Tax=Croceibacterium atlanticum TaxID=1267766 RepID=A0A0F7KTR1_9SPHN|nr:2Fe-2S iron-sulfur cluster-binding protein [Croceibacterium atlanticum]AKH42536.1 Nicotinate dehydrogenase small FeS subunit [Croceibacterium atlanticum]MBB5731313.1 xanthine dehydrogenase YagT iron-sulfur-binding subunit [Croceibacterium atlanticum]
MPITINDQTHELPDDPRVSLLDFLRHHLGLTGSKKGCDHGQCGACTVLVNGMRINSCLSLAVTHDGDSVTTIEGLGTPAQPSALQQAFVDHDGYQCGYCTPGQICSATAMLQELANDWPSDASESLTGPVEINGEELRERMSGNICRCGAYANIIAAIRHASEGERA